MWVNIPVFPLYFDCWPGKAPLQAVSAPFKQKCLLKGTTDNRELVLTELHVRMDGPSNSLSLFSAASQLDGLLTDRESLSERSKEIREKLRGKGLPAGKTSHTSNTHLYIKHQAT